MHRQRGAIGLLGAVTLLLAILFMALAVDAGRLWMQRRQLQLVADIASIQAARSLGCSPTLANVIAAAQAAATNNGYTGTLASSPNEVELGSVATINGIRNFTADESSPEAVRVKATREVPASLIAGGLWKGNVLLSAEAVSRADPAIAMFSAGSFAASFDSSDSALLNGLLGGMLGSSLNLSLVSYQGIANSEVTLDQLVTASGNVGGVDGLLNSSMSVGDLASLTASAMQQSGAAATAISAMNTIASAGAGSAGISLGDIVNVTTPDTEAAGKAKLNALSLIMAAATIANGNHAVSMPIGVSIPGLISANAQITIIEPPQFAIGPAGCTSVQTAQVDATATVNVPVTVGISLLNLNLSTHLQVAQAEADLDSINYSDGQTVVTIDASPGIASVNGSGQIKLLGAPIGSIGLNVPIQSSQPQPLVFTVDNPADDHLPQTQTVSSSLSGSLQNALGQSGVITVSVVGADVLGTKSALINNSLVTNALSSIASQAGKTLFDPLLKVLGIRVGGMDVTLESLQMHQEKPLII